MILFSKLKSGLKRWRLAWLLWAAVLPVSLAQAVDAPTRTVRVGVYENAPKLFLGKGGQPSGILGDVLMAMAELERWQVVAVPCEWQACLNALGRGEIDPMAVIAEGVETALKPGSGARQKWPNPPAPGCCPQQWPPPGRRSCPSTGCRA